MNDRNAWDVFEDEDGLYHVSWRPARGHPEFPGRTYAAGEPNLPEDFPADATKENLEQWCDQRWGKSRAFGG